ncbi:MAG TPA: hypothetical protein V6D08_19530, partial [Candidatus Obscuribacterales bacterium]
SDTSRLFPRTGVPAFLGISGVGERSTGLATYGTLTAVKMLRLPTHWPEDPFSEEQLIEFAADAAQENYRARWNRVFDIGSDGLYCVIPPRH